MTDAFPMLDEFAARQLFPLDEFQVDGCRSVESDHGVLVCAPTGAGKTIVGEFAVFLALRRGLKCFYTTPIKALSNQKYHDLVDTYGEERIGLLTGDVSINGGADIVVMTTEVLRNMLYAGSSTLAGLGFVVMDEVHYLADRFRGAVWEEVLIHLPESVQVVALSATVSNAEEFGDWMQQVRGDTDVVITEHRPVPLYQHMMVGHSMYDLLVQDDEKRLKVNPRLLERISLITRGSRGGRRFDAGAPSGRRGRGRRLRGGRHRGALPGRPRAPGAARRRSRPRSRPRPPACRRLRPTPPTRSAPSAPGPPD